MKRIGLIFLAMAVVFCLFAVSQASFNLTIWDKGMREFCAFIMGITAFGGCLLSYLTI